MNTFTPSANAKRMIYVLALLLAACGGGSGGGGGNPPPATYTVGGTASGLSGAGLELTDNGGDRLSVAANGSFTFPTALASGASYDVTVFTQPANPAQTCTAANASGTIGAANVTNVTVTCTTAGFLVGGTIIGLTGSGLVLQDNGGDNLSVTANGSFHFATPVASGAGYAVTVLTQPSNPAETCGVGAGSGTVGSENVASVEVICTPNSAGTGFWIPYLATPAPSTSGGLSGVFVIPSGSLASAPSPTFLSTTPSTILGIGWQTTLNGSGILTAYAPEVMIYAATDAGNVAHLYGVNLSQSSNAPVPVQVSNLALSAAASLSALGQICDFQDAEGNANDPTTLFVFLHLAGTGGCNSGTDIYEVVHYTDSATTNPTLALSAEFASTTFTPLYQAGGLLGGAVLVDTSNNLDFLNGINFTGENVLAGNILTVTPLTGQTINTPTPQGAATALFATTPTSGSGTSVYIVNVAAGTASQVYSTTGTLSHGVTDNTYLYFIDTVGGTTPSAKIVQMSLATGTNSVLYGFTPAANTVYDVIGSNTSLLLFDATAVGAATTTTLMSIPIAGAGNPSSVGATLNGTVTAYLIAAGLNDPANDLLFVDVANVSNSGSFSYSSEVLTPDGATIQPLLANSTFLDRTTALSGAVLQIRGITDTAGGYGGGTLYSVAISNSLTRTPFTASGGGAYAWPSGYGGFALGLSNTIGAADLSSGVQQSAAAYDAAQFLIYPLTLTNTDIIF